MWWKSLCSICAGRIGYCCFFFVCFLTCVAPHVYASIVLFLFFFIDLLLFFWSGAYGTSLRWLHEVSVTFYIWLYSLLTSGVHVLLHECVPGFDPAIIEAVLSPVYFVQSLVWSSLDEGLPIRRERRYTICIRKDLGLSIPQWTESFWCRVAFCNRVSTAHIFLQASDDDIEALRTHWCSKRGLPVSRIRSDGSPGKWAWEVLLTSAERKVVLQMRTSANAWIAEQQPQNHEHREGERHGGVDFKWLVNLSQSLSFQPRLGLEVFPALLRSSKFFLESVDGKQSRPIHPLEAFAMQGIPVFLERLPQEHFACNCKFQEALTSSDISLSSMSNISGNGMNCSSVGKVLFYICAFL